MAAGDRVNPGDPVVELVTEKAEFTLESAVERANTTYAKGYAIEEERHELRLDELNAEVKTLRGSLRLATKVVKFAEED